MALSAEDPTGEYQQSSPARRGLTPEMERVLEEQARLHRDVFRPIDRRMLDDLHRALMDRTVIYARILKAVIEDVHNRDDAVPRPPYVNPDRTIAESVVALDAKIPLWKQNIQTVVEFLRDVRAQRGMVEPVRFWPVASDSAHCAALLLFRRMSDLWNELQERWQTERLHALSGVTVSDLFYREWINDHTVSGDEVQSKLRLEHALACQALAEQSRASEPDTKGGIAPKSKPRHRPKRATRATAIETLTNWLKQYIADERDARRTAASLGRAPRPDALTQAQLAKATGMPSWRVSRCLGDPKAELLRSMWQKLTGRDPGARSVASPKDLDPS